MKSNFASKFPFLVLSGFIFSAVHTSLLGALPIYLGESGVRPEQMGVIVGSYALSAALFRLFGGGLVDTVRFSRMFQATGLLLTASFLLYFFMPPGILLVIPRMLQGLALAVFYTAAYAWIAVEADEDAKGKAFGIFGAAAGLSIMLMPAIGVHLIHLHADFFFLGAAALSAVLVLIAVDGSKDRPTQDERVVLIGFRGLPVGPILVIVFVSAAVGVMEAYLPEMAQARRVENLFALFLFFGLSLAVGRIAGGIAGDKFSRTYAIGVSIGVLLLSGGVLLVFAQPSVMFFSAILFGLGVGGATNGAYADVSDRVPIFKQGRVLGLAAFFGEGAISLGALVGALGVSAIENFIPIFIIALSLAAALAVRFGTRSVLVDHQVTE